MSYHPYSVTTDRNQLKPKTTHISASELCNNKKAEALSALFMAKLDPKNLDAAVEKIKKRFANEALKPDDIIHFVHKSDLKFLGLKSPEDPITLEAAANRFAALDTAREMLAEYNDGTDQALAIIKHCVMPELNQNPRSIKR